MGSLDFLANLKLSTRPFCPKNVIPTVFVAKAAIWDHSDLEARPDDRISLHLSSLARGQGGEGGSALGQNLADQLQFESAMSNVGERDFAVIVQSFSYFFIKVA